MTTTTRMFRAAKLSLLAFLTGVLAFRHLKAEGYLAYIMHDAIFGKWFRRGVIVVGLSIVCYHCAHCQAPQDTLPTGWWYRAMVPYDTSRVRPDSIPDYRDTMDIIAILPDWETGQVQTVKGRMIRQADGVGWAFYIVRQKCEEVPRTVGKKTIYEYQCTPVFQKTEPQKIAHYYIRPQPQKAVTNTTLTPDR